MRSTQITRPTTIAYDHTGAVRGIYMVHDNAESFDIDALYDSLYLVPAGEVSCHMDFSGVDGPNGSSWAWGADDSDLPPWIAPEELTYATPCEETCTGEALGREHVRRCF